MQKIWLLSILLLLLLPMAAAEGPYKQNKQADIILDHSQYPGCVGQTCQITLFYPNSSLFLNHTNTTQNIGFSNISLRSTQTGELGVYHFTINSLNTTPAFYDGEFEINPTGHNQSLVNAIIAGLAVLFLFGVGVALLFFGNLYANEQSEVFWIGILAIGVGLIMFYFDIFLFLKLLRDIAYTTDLYIHFRKLFILGAWFEKAGAYLFLAIALWWAGQKYIVRKKAKNSSDGWDENKY